MDKQQTDAAPPQQSKASRPADRVDRQRALARTVTWAKARLKAELIQEKLRSMPGWKAVPGNQAVDRVRELASPEMATAWAVYVLQAAAMRQQRVGVELSGSQVTVTVRGPGSAARRNLFPLDALEFAKQLG